jgi:neuralized-like protein 4
VTTSKPLHKGHTISVKVTQINSKWKGTIAVGALGVCPSTHQFPYPTSAILFRRPCYIATHDFININGTKTQSKYAEIFEQIQVGTVISVTLTHTGNLSITFGQTVLDDLASGLSHYVYPIFDLYGKCEKITILNGDIRAANTPMNDEFNPLPENELLNDTENVPQSEGKKYSRK